MTCIYDKAVKKFDVENDKIYFVDKKAVKLYASDFSGNVNVVTNESVGEWVNSQASTAPKITSCDVILIILEKGIDKHRLVILK